MASNLSAQHRGDVSGLVAVVTGGGTGIGAIIAKALAANGAKVYITGRRIEKLEETSKQASPGQIIPIQGSASDHADLQRAVDVVTNDTGRIDLLVCNAGVSTRDTSPGARDPPTAQASISEIRDYYFNHRPKEVWNYCFEMNITSVFSTSMAFLELLDAGNKRRPASQPTSQIVVVGSVGGLTRGIPNFIYNSSKAGVHHLAKNLGAFLVPHDIRTNVIAPGWFPTDMTVPVQKQHEANNGVMPRELVPRQRMGNEDEMAGTILYLASKAGGYCNGHVLVIDGGFLVNHAGS